jgi:hypothetical protein
MAHLIAPNVTFNHLGRCGGSWVIAACKNAGCYLEMQGSPPHSSHSIRRSAFTFSFVRHPFTRIASWHAYKATHKKQKYNPPDPLWQPDLNKTVLTLCTEIPGRLTEEYRKYTMPTEGCISYVGQQEYLADHLVIILRLAGVEFDEAALRSTPRQNEAATPPGQLSKRAKAELMRTEVGVFRTFYPSRSIYSNRIQIFPGHGARGGDHDAKSPGGGH